MALSLFRFAAILQAVYARALRKNAASATALDVGSGGDHLAAGRLTRRWLVACEVGHLGIRARRCYDGSVRYAIYFIPEPRSELARFGAAWLGRDVETGRVCMQPAVSGFAPDALAALTAEPRRYGLHGTLKPPVALAAGCTETEFLAAVEDFAAKREGFDLPPLQLASIGRFLALVPSMSCPAVNALADACLEALDKFRRPPDAHELERRRVGGLTAKQDGYLLRWGYPYVSDEYRFHITLTGRLDNATREQLMLVLDGMLAPLARRAVPVNNLCVAVEVELGGNFSLLRRFPLRKPG
jgi:putative phosphonate metabolism protein